VNVKIPVTSPAVSPALTPKTVQEPVKTVKLEEPEEDTDFVQVDASSSPAASSSPSARVEASESTQLYPALSSAPAQTQAPVAAALSSFEGKLAQLEEMGFKNRSVNLEVLVKNRGEILPTVRDLLALQH